MAVVVSIEKARRVWVTGPVVCGACGHSASTVYPGRAPGFKPWGLPCPACGLGTLVALDEAFDACSGAFVETF